MYSRSILSRLGIEVLSDHECYLEGDCVLKLTQIKAGQLSDLFQSVYQGVSMYEQLSGGLGYVEVVFKEALNGHQRLAVECFQTAFLEYFLQEHLTKRGGQLIDQTANTQILIADNVLFGLKYLTDLRVCSGMVPS